MLSFAGLMDRADVVAFLTHWPTASGSSDIHPGAVEAGYDRIRLAEFGVEDQTDEIMRPPLSGLVRADNAQYLRYLYTSMAECTVRDAPIARARIDNTLKKTRMAAWPLTGQRFSQMPQPMHRS